MPTQFGNSEVLSHKGDAFSTSSYAAASLEICYAYNIVLHRSKRLIHNNIVLHLTETPYILSLRMSRKERIHPLTPQPRVMANCHNRHSLAIFMKWVESKLVELTDSVKVAGRPTEELEEIVHLTGEVLEAQLQTDHFDPVLTAVNSIIDAFVELQTGVARLSSSAGAKDTIFAAFDKRLDNLTTQVKSLADVVQKTVVPIMGRELAEATRTLQTLIQRYACLCQPLCISTNNVQALLL
jgi:hypothetical protein